MDIGALTMDAVSRPWPPAWQTGEPHLSTRLVAPMLARDGVSDEETETHTYRVVVNDEEQFSVWPVDKEVPPGWRDEGTTGTKDECLAHIATVWTDMRPLSLRRHMAAAESGDAE